MTIKQENFCNYYVETGNASEAYRRAYSCSNMKDGTVKVKAAELLKNGNVSVTINRLRKALQKRSDIAKDEAVKELTNIVRFRVTNVMSIKGSRVIMKALSDLPDEIVSCISSVKKVKGCIEVKFFDKIAAIDRLSKMLGWDKEIKVEVTGSVPVKEWLRKFSNTKEGDDNSNG